MSWMVKLSETFDNIVKGDLPDKKNLVPISHTLQNAHIKIVIDQEGNFKRASVLEKAQIILPATENSAGRSSGEAPHPLADKLQYVAKDYADYGGVKKPYFDGYRTLLSSWCESPFSHPKAQAVYSYIEQGRVIEDLIQSEIVYVDNENVLLAHWDRPVTEEQPIPLLFKLLPKDKGKQDQGSALVCWVVEIEDDKCPNTWQDEGLQKSWVEFYKSFGLKKGLCCIAGGEDQLATNHPAKLRHTGDKAKIVSFNDKNGYTYRGKFIDDMQACQVGFGVSQKAHNALRWLISRQGYRNSDQVIVAWAITVKDIPSPMIDSYYLLREDDFDEVLDENEEEEARIDHGRNLGQEFATRLNKKIAGYRAKLNDFEKIVVMGLDSATPGRMSITYYREANAKEYFERLESWHWDFAWPQRHKKELIQTDNKKAKFKIVWLVGSPAPRLIAEVAYGHKLKDNLKKKTIERLLPCILDKMPLPKDLLDACVRRASNPNAYGKEEKWRWLDSISVACALCRGYYSDRNPNINERRDYKMSLERSYNSRDYLYGRLLALAEQIEKRALDNAGESRITNAERLMQHFSSRPYTTWKNIDESLRPYRDRLKASKHAGLLQCWEREIQQICDLFNHETFRDDRPLMGEYLLGYYCQKNYRKPKDVEISNTLGVTTNNETN